MTLSTQIIIMYQYLVIISLMVTLLPTI